MSSNDQNRSRKILVPLATMAVAAAVVVGSGATWTSESSSTVSVTSGNILHGNDHDLKTLTVSNMKPGDVYSGTVTITNKGTLSSRLQITETASPNGFYVAPATSTTASKSDLQLLVKRGTQTIYNGDFDKFSAYDSGAKNASAAIPAADPDSTADDAVIQFTVSLDINADTTSQGQAADATFAFVTQPLDGQTGLLGSWGK
jgi:hypothetical protein